MAYTDPRLADHAEGLEQQIIELGARIGYFDSNRATWHDADALRRRRRELIGQLADASAALTEPPRSADVEIHALPVTRRPHAA